MTGVRVGAVDCGTNSIRLLIADVDAATGALRDVVRRAEVVRLGHGVDRTGRIDPAAMERTIAMTATYAAQCREHRVERVRFVATSASRDASNAGEFVAGVRTAFDAADLPGVAPEVVSGDEEARLSFLGATGEVAAAGYPGPFLVVDLGGGSTEIVRGETSVQAARSLDIGSVRLTERHLRSDPPTPAEVAAARADITAGLGLAAAVVGFGDVGTLVGLAGSITTVTAQALALSAYDRDAIHLAALSPAEVVTAADEIVGMSRAERAALPFMHPGRVDVIGAGALIWREVVTRVVGASGLRTVVTSEHDILDGIAVTLAG